MSVIVKEIFYFNFYAEKSILSIKLQLLSDIPLVCETCSGDVLKKKNLRKSNQSMT